jgi:hypothetical protein
VEVLPFFVFIGFGLYFLLTALVPSWREPGWRHWKIFAGEDNSRSLLVQLGFQKINKPVKEGDFSKKTAVWLFIIFGSVLVFLGAAGVVWIAYFESQRLRIGFFETPHLC